MVRKIPLTKGYVALVDDEDFAELSQFRWHASVQPTAVYAKRYITVDGHPVAVPMQNAILKPPSGYVVDHRDGDALDNRKENLRVATPTQNCRNKGPARSNKAGFRGVSPCRSMWRATIYVDGKPLNLGNFGTPEEAARAYDVAARSIFREFARPNFQDEIHAPAEVWSAAASKCVRAPRAIARFRRQSASGFRGVEFDRAKDRWRAVIRANGARRRLGWFRTAQEAARAYDAAAREIQGEAAILNFAEAA